MNPFLRDEPYCCINDVEVEPSAQRQAPTQASAGLAQTARQLGVGASHDATVALRRHTRSTMRLIQDASCRALSGDLQANLLQLPVVVVSFGAIALQM